MLLAEKVLLYLTLFTYTLAIGLLFFAIFFKRESLVSVTKKVIITGVILNTATLLVRTVSAGRPPVKGDYENALTAAWFTMVLLLYLGRRWTGLWKANIGVLPVILLTLGWAMQRGQPDLAPLTPAYDNPWLYIHVFFAWFGYASFLVAAILGIVILIRARKPEALLAFGDVRTLDELSHRLVAFGFAMTTVMIASGAIWAKDLYGSYWSWDPVETWSLLSWLVYALYLHLRTMFGWRGAKAAWLAVLSFSTVLISFWGVNFIQDSYHIFQRMF